MANTTIGTLNVKVKFSMWQALKIRVSGLYKTIEKVERVGDVIEITYAKKTIIA